MEEDFLLQLHELPIKIDNNWMMIVDLFEKDKRSFMHNLVIKEMLKLLNSQLHELEITGIIHSLSDEVINNLTSCRKRLESLL